MSPSAEACAHDILETFQKSWTLGVEDLNQSESDQRLKIQVETAPENLRARLDLEFFDWGPLSALCNDPEVTEILVIGWQKVCFEKAGQLHLHSDRFLHPITFRRILDRLLSEAQIFIDQSRPFANGRWRDFRVHAVCSPICSGDMQLSLRRSQTHQWDWARLEQAGWATLEQLELLKEQILVKKNILIVGPTSSGKTSVLSAFLSEIGQAERALILEDTHELSCPNSLSSNLLTRPAGPSLPEVDLGSLVKQSLRMRPDRLVIGEVRGSEAKNLLLALATGHSGCFGTLHASDPHQALLRLEMLVQMGAPQWDIGAIRKLIHLSIHTIVVCGFENGQRHLKGIFKVAGLESFGLLIESLI